MLFRFFSLTRMKVTHDEEIPKHLSNVDEAEGSMSAPASSKTPASLSE
jgi:hypothetical protein